MGKTGRENRNDNGKIWSSFILGETDEKFCDLGVALDARFWPMCEPILTSLNNEKTAF